MWPGVNGIGTFRITYLDTDRILTPGVNGVFVKTTTVGLIVY